MDESNSQINASLNHYDTMGKKGAYDHLTKSKTEILKIIIFVSIISYVVVFVGISGYYFIAKGLSLDVFLEVSGVTIGIGVVLALVGMVLLMAYLIQNMNATALRGFAGGSSNVGRYQNHMINPEIVELQKKARGLTIDYKLMIFGGVFVLLGYLLNLGFSTY